MAAIIQFSLQNFKWVNIRYKYIKQLPKVFFGCFYMFTKFPITREHLTRDNMCQTRNIICHKLNILTTKKGHMTQKTTVVI